MSSIIKSALKTSLAQNLYSDLISKRSRYYFFLGKPLVWDPVTPSDVPETPLDSFAYELETRKNIVSAKQLKAPDVCFIVTRHDWVSGDVYDMYDDTYSASNHAHSGAASLQDAIFYVVNGDYNVYKCISNNYNALSTVQPTGTSTNLLITADGYIWKYMYNIPVALRNKFLTAAYMPVLTSLKDQFYSSGAITHISIPNSGSGYMGVPILTVDGDGYIADNPVEIKGFIVTTQGAGYATAPTVTVSAPTVTTGIETVCEGTAVLDTGKVASITLDVAGYGYAGQPTIVIDPPVTGAFEFIDSHLYPLNSKIFWENNYYEVTIGGTTSTTKPTHTTGDVINGTATLTYLGTRATAIAVAVKTNASLTAILSHGTSGEIIDVVINDGGTAYSYATVIISGGNPTSNAELYVDLSSGDLNSIQSSVELSAIDGALQYIKVTNEGVGYDLGATVLIQGDGVGAVATATTAGGHLTSIDMVSAGTGYTYATITVVPVGVGASATARAIISPLGGHGKNAETELFATDIMFYSAISSDKNQGFTLSNDYRQFGVVRNMEKYVDTSRYTGIYGSACFALTGTVNLTHFAIDMELTDAATGNKFTIIALTATEMLVQSLVNSTCYVNQALINSSNNVFSVTAVAEPDFDKFSGELFFIDNRTLFIPSVEQSIVLRSIISF